jgi:hypothetical protein
MDPAHSERPDTNHLSHGGVVTVQFDEIFLYHDTTTNILFRVTSFLQLIFNKQFFLVELTTLLRNFD